MSYRHEEYIPPESRPLSAPPHPHAYKKPNITLEQLDAIKTAQDDGHITAHARICRGLVNRGLAVYGKRGTDGRRICTITEAGILLIRTQYSALRQVLEDRR